MLDSWAERMRTQMGMPGPAVKLEIDERKDEFFQAEVSCSPPYMKCFYIAQNSIEAFITEILIPLLTLVYNVKDYKWRKINGKKGFLF